jgi:hypothetical protein
VANEEEMLDELKQIRFHLSLLTHDIRSRAFSLFEREVLKTDARAKMFYALDDEKNAMQIAEAAGVTRQAALNLLHDLERGGFITLRTVGQAQVGKQNIDKILDWFQANPRRGA